MNLREIGSEPRDLNISSSRCEV